MPSLICSVSENQLKHLLASPADGNAMSSAPTDSDKFCQEIHFRISLATLIFKFSPRPQKVISRTQLSRNIHIALGYFLCVTVWASFPPFHIQFHRQLLQNIKKIYELTIPDICLFFSTEAIFGKKKFSHKSA